jgi:HSP20 family protein
MTQRENQGGTETGLQTGRSQTGIHSTHNRHEPHSQSLLGTPFSLIRRFGEDMDRLFEDFGFGRGLRPAFGRDLFPRSLGELDRSLWSPQVEVFERDGRLFLRADLPGLTKDDVNVEITDDAIVISGERRKEQEEKREGYYHTERSYGSFYRRIQLPEGVNADDAHATFRNGVLEINLKAPQREQRGRRLEIKDESGEHKTGASAKAATTK